MATVTKTQGIVVLPLQIVAADTVVTSDPVDVSTAFSGSVFIHFGRTDTTGTLDAAALIRIEASADDTGNNQWFPLVNFRSNRTTPASEVLTSTIAAATKTLTMASTTGFARGDVILIKNSTFANSEFHRIVAVTTNTSVTIIDGITNSQTGSTIYNQAEMYVSQLDLTAIGRIRVVADCSDTGRETAIAAYLVTGDSIS